jgi:hypothetical protein
MSALLHEAPKRFHLYDALDRQANDLGVRLDSKRLFRPLKSAIIDEEGFPF